MKKTSILIIIILIAGCQNTGKHNEVAKPVNEKTFVGLGGEKQYVEISGASDQLPVVLFLHGGPAWPQTPHLRYFNADLTKEVILVSWDQAGCGKSYMENPNPENLSPESLVQDAHELTEYLKKKFNREKIVLVGFSYGSVIGLQLASRYPEDYSAFIGVSQVVNMQDNWDASMSWLKEQAMNRKDTAALRQLDLLDRRDSSLCSSIFNCFMNKYQLLVKYGGTVYSDSVSKEIEKAERFYDDYKDYNWLDAFNTTIARLGDSAFTTDLSHIKSLQVPVYFIAGRHDWNIPGIVTEKYNYELSAPKKEFIWFEKSGHEVPEEEPDKFNETVLRIVKENRF